MMTRTRLFAGALALGALLTGCKDSTSNVPSTLVAAPSRISLTESEPTGKMFLTTSPSGGKLNWQVVSKPSWITVTPSSGTVKGTMEVSVEATVPANVEPGMASGTIELVSNGGTASVPVDLLVQPNPLASTSVASVALADNADSAKFTLTNTGRGTLQWSLASSRAEVTVAPSQGFLGTGQSVVIKVMADKRPLPAGTTQATLTLTSNQKAGAVVLPVTVAVPATPSAYTSLGRLGFSSDASTRSFWLYSTGKGALTWQAAAADGWLAPSPASGQLASGDSVKVTVTLNRAALGGSEGSSSVTITSNSVGGAIVLPVVVTGSSGLAPGSLTLLDHTVIDAEYSARGSMIVTVSANPSQLTIIDLFTGAISHVALSLPPTAVSVRPDGAYAAVGHDGRVTYVNLGTRSVVRTYAVTTDAIDVILPQNGWVYVFPRTDQWESIRSVNLTTGLESTGSGYQIYAGTVAKLHPSGDFMYGANRGLSPSDFEKYDIRSGAATVMYDSPYHGDYAFSGDIWISEDGARLFARSGNVFGSSPVRSQDMLYAGKLAGMDAVMSVADSRASGRIFAIAADGVFGGNGVSEIRVYDQQFMAFRGTVALPRFPSGGSTVAGQGQFVFANADGDRVYVLERSTGNGQLWGLGTLATSGMP